MSEEEARSWVAERFGRPAVDRLAVFADLVREENTRQNLIAPSTVADIWTRHIVDSLQLVALARHPAPWLDIGTGGGFPGLAIALAEIAPIILVEPRRKRADFLQGCIDHFGLTSIQLLSRKVEQVQTAATTISARAVASVENLLRAAAHCATPQTQWLLPRGSVDREELGHVAARHGMVFHVEQSLTHTESKIVVMSTR